MLPDFIVIGAMKAGTTSLYRYLAAHPQVFMPSQKELRFFADAHNWGLGLAWYGEQFENGATALIRGEASPAYSAYPLNPEVPARMASIIPDAKLLYLVRHPIDRLETHWRYLVQRGGPLPKRIDEAVIHYPPLLDRSRYATQIERYMEHFSRDQLLVLVSERLRHDRQRTMARVFEFLGVDPEMLPETLDREFHGTAEQRGRLRWAQAIRRVPGYSGLARRLPNRLRALNYQITTRYVHPSRAIVSDAIRSQLEEKLQPEIERLRDYIDDPEFDGWGIG